jgi:hypothetical protein
MTTPIRYSFELLQRFCSERKVKLVETYDNIKLYGSTKINFYCTTCNKENVKFFSYLIKRNTLCKRCVTIASLSKQKATMVEKYGVEHASQNKEIRDKIRDGFIEKYGVDNPSKLQKIKDKQKKTNLERYGVEYIVHNKESKDKMVQTNIEKYGSECCLQNVDIIEKIKNTNLKKFGFENVGQNLEVHEKMKSTMFEKYGVNYPLQNKEIMKKTEETCFKKYGVRNPLLSVDIQRKRMGTIKDRYGVEYPSQNKEIRQKTIETFIKRYGFENPMQNPEIAEKSSENCYKPKSFIFPSGHEITCQGYEPFALQELIEINVDEDDIITGCKNVPTIWYNDENGEKHRHYVDIFIPSKNTCIEVKSSWTILKKSSNIFEKQTAAKELGYKYEIWVYDNNGNKLEVYD